MLIKTSKHDVLWNYAATFLSMFGSFLLIPLMLLYLTQEEMGLWYVYIAVAGFAQLLEMGFTSTISRNILYAFSGVQGLQKSGAQAAGSAVDWHLARVTIRTSRVIYVILATFALLVASTVGTAYIASVTGGFAVAGSLASWILFPVAIFGNLLFLFYLTELRGVGDVAAESKARALGKLLQLGLSFALLYLGLGLMGASIAYVAYCLGFAVLAKVYFARHADVVAGLKSDARPVTRAEIKDCFTVMSHIAFRDGLVGFSNYGRSQAMALICPLFFGLAETATYSVMLQLSAAVVGLAGVLLSSSMPEFQASFAHQNTARMREICSRGVSFYLVACVALAVGIMCVALPILPALKDGFICDQMLFAGLVLYQILGNQHSLYCCMIVARNQIPYCTSYVASAVLGVLAVVLACQVPQLGMWALVIGPFAVQLAYNNWYWPRYLHKCIGNTYFESLRMGFTYWKDCLVNLRERVTPRFAGLLRPAFTSPAFGGAW